MALERRNQPQIPIELYRNILEYIPDKEDLLSTSAVSLLWQIEVEKILWVSVTLCDDSFLWEGSYLNLLSATRLRLIVERFEHNVLRLTLRFPSDKPDCRYASSSLRPVPRALSWARHSDLHQDEDAKFLKVSKLILQAIGSMTKLCHLTIYNSGGKRLVNNLNDEAVVCSDIVRSVKSIQYRGASLLQEYLQFFQRCSNLENLSCSASHGDLGAIQNFEHASWTNLTTFTGSPDIAIALLSSASAMSPISQSFTSIS